MDIVGPTRPRGGVQRWILHRFLVWFSENAVASVVVGEHWFDLTDGAHRDQLIDEWASATPPEWR